VNKIGGILATLGVKGYRALKGDRREQRIHPLCTPGKVLDLF
jgi:hypothetical protein